METNTRKKNIFLIPPAIDNQRITMVGGGADEFYEKKESPLFKFAFPLPAVSKGPIRARESRRRLGVRGY